MIKRGPYRVLQVLNISHSLYSQIESQPKEDAGAIRKCLLEGIDAQCIAYFIDPIDFGRGTQIEILKELAVPLVSKKDFKVLKREEYRHDTKFVSKLIENKP